MSNAITGAYQVLVYIWEDKGEYNQQAGKPSDTSWKVFGSDETMDSQDRANNAERHYRPFDRNAAHIIEGEFDGSWSVDPTLTNPWWLQFVYGEHVSTTAVAEGTEYVYKFDPRSPPKSAHIIEETHFPDGEIEQTVYTGSIVSGVGIDVSLGDAVGVSLDGAYATEESFSTARGEALPYGSSSDGIAEQPDNEYRPLHFGNSALYMDLDGSGTIESNDFQVEVQDVTFDIEGNAELQGEIGTRFKTIPAYLNFEHDLSYTKLVSANNRDQEKRLMYGSEAAQTPQETLSDSEIMGEVVFNANTEKTNKLTLEATGTFPDSFNRNNVGSPEDVIEQDIDRYIADVTAKVVTADAPK